MNRKKLLAYLREHYAYKGGAVLADVQAFVKQLAEDGTEIQFAGGDTLDKVWARTEKAVIGEAGEPEPDEATKALESVKKELQELKRDLDKADAKKVVNDTKGTPTDTPRSIAERCARKAFEAKAAKGETVMPDYDAQRAVGAMMRFLIADKIEATNFRYDKRAADIETMKSVGISVIGKAQVTYNDAQGGALFQEQFDPSLIALKEKVGVARQVLGTTPMANDTKKMPRELDDMSDYAVGETTAVTEDEVNFNTVTLNARKRGVLTKLSSEILHDAEVNIAERVMFNMARAFTKTEDNAFLNGDGTSTYMGVTGVRDLLADIDGAGTDARGLVEGTGNLWSELTTADHLNVIGRTADYPEGEGANRYVWIVSKEYMWAVMQRLALASGGVTYAEFQGRKTLDFLGYPVVTSIYMPRTEANSQVCAVFGQFALGAKFGEVTGSSSIQTSDQRYFDQDLVAIRGLQRIAITVHEINSNTAAGPIAGLITASS